MKLKLGKKQIRARFRKEVFERDRHKCGCNETKNLEAHHIINRNYWKNGGYKLDNGITLCPECHMKAEVYYMTSGEKWEPGFHPDELLREIRSPYRLIHFLQKKINK